MKVSENCPWNLAVAYGFAKAEAKSKQIDASCFDYYYCFVLYFEIKMILFLPAAKNRTKILFQLLHNGNCLFHPLEGCKNQS